MRSSAVFVLSILAVACGGGSSPTSPTSNELRVTSLSLAGNLTFTERDEQSQPTATARMSDGSSQDQTQAAAWSSSNTAVATINASGQVTALTTGTTQIAATFSGLSDSKPVNVSLACQINNTARIRFGNRSSKAGQDIIWNGIKLVWLDPGQTSDYMAVAAGVAHRLTFQIVNSTSMACTNSSPVLVQCSINTITCAFP